VREKEVKCFKCNQYGHVTVNYITKGGSVKDVKKYNIAQANAGPTKRYLKTIEINDYEAAAIMDTGSTFSMMREDYYNKIGAPSLINQPINFECWRKSERNVRKNAGKGANK